MTAYASSDITGFYNPRCPKGGHQRKLANARGVRHGEKPVYEDERLVVDCPVCESEPAMELKDSWSKDPLEVPQTKAERLEAERDAKEAAAAAAEFSAAIMAEARANVEARRALAGRG